MSHRDSLPLDDGSLFLTDAGMETVLIFHQGQDLPSFATFPLLEHEEGRAALRTYYEPFLELARTRGTGFILGGATWRANSDWGEELGYDREALALVNRRAIEFIEELRLNTPDSQPVVLLEAPIGPRGDAYAPSSLMSAAEAEAYHSPQMRTLADTAVRSGHRADAHVRRRGNRDGARRAGRRSARGGVVHGRDRRPAAERPDAARGDRAGRRRDGRGAVHYMINCAHPTHFAGALADGGPWIERIRGLRANASTLSHAELDEAEELDDGDPADLAARHVALRGTLPNLTIVGGCCGTDVRHVTSICDAWIRGSD